MIIPIKCFTCGEVLENKYRYYLQEVKRLKIENNIETNKVTYLSKDQKVESITLDQALELISSKRKK